MPNKPPKVLMERIALAKNKRARVVLDRIAKNGSITTDELNEIGYNHPPRAARDVRELGFPLKTIMVGNSRGGRMARYEFDDKVLEAGKAGRRILPRKQRNEIIAAAGAKCGICGGASNLQVDHRIPYEIGGESTAAGIQSFQVLCGSCNRTKSWDCEHCGNRLQGKTIEACEACYWANPSDHSHVRMQEQRRVDLVWIGEDTKRFDDIREAARANHRTPAAEIKSRLLG